MNNIDEQRYMAIMMQAQKSVMGALRFIRVKRVINYKTVCVEVEARITDENLRQVQQCLDVTEKVNAKIEPELQGCERLGNIIYIALAEYFPDNRINVTIQQSDDVEVVVFFNHQKQKT